MWLTILPLKFGPKNAWDEDLVELNPIVSFDELEFGVWYKGESIQGE